MSEIAVIGFHDSHRGLQVMGELWRLNEGLGRDLDTALVLSWESNGKLLVRQGVNLSTGEGVRWGRFWGALIRVTLFCRHTDQMSAAAKAMMTAAEVLSQADLAIEPDELDARWWKEELGLPTEFLRDIGAMIQPGDSAIFILLQKENHLQVVRQLTNYGGTLLHATLDGATDVKVRDVLGLTDPAKATA